MVHFLVFILVSPIVLLVSILPFRILYVLSDLIFLLLFYVIGYRKKVVYDNLKIAFPEKSEDEIKNIRKKFYHHFVDLLVETIKTFTISNKEILKRFHLTNKDEFSELLNKHQHIVLMGSHYANYEWIFSINLLFDHEGYAAYKKVKNKYLDSFIRKSRGRFNSQIIPSKLYLKIIEENSTKQISTISGLLSDQSPKLQSTRHWSNFFNVKVPVFISAELIAKKYNYPITCLITEKIKRGFYRTTMHVLSENPREVPDYEITDLYIKMLETQIINKPEYYFWTHRRFKHAKNV